MFSTDFIFRQPEMSGWIQATMQQNTSCAVAQQIHSNLKGDQLTNIDVNRNIIHGIINIYFLFTIPTMSKTRKLQFIIADVSSNAYHEISRHFCLEPTKGHTAQYQFGYKTTSGSATSWSRISPNSKRRIV